MTLEIIIIAIFTSAAALAAILAVHNIRELQDTRVKRDEAEERNYSLELENEGLVRRIEELKLELNAEQKNSKELRRIIIDYEIAANSQQEEPGPAAAEKEETIPAGFLPPAGIPTNTYRCEDYTGFSQNSEQNMLQEECFTDAVTGIRYFFDDAGWWYCAALAGAYGTEIGHCYTFELANGNFIHVIQADFKHDISDPRPDDYGDDDVNYDGEKCINVIEFVVDMDRIPTSVKKAGTMSALDSFGGLYGDGGNIVKVTDEGRRWKP